jgi:hypothetical protein
MEDNTMQPARRPFGEVEDLDLEFTSADRPTLVTALLGRCAGGGDDHWWSQPVGTRIAALLHLYMSNEGSDRIELSARCVQAECNETFGFELPLRALAIQAPMPETLDVLVSDNRRVTLRRPIGRDLSRWCLAQPATRVQAMRMMLDDLIVDGRPKPNEEPAIADAIIACDPLVALTVAAECPACGHSQDVAVDVEGLVLTHFGGRQRAMLYDVHRLATRYGWTERQVLAVPPSRRAAYLALIDGDLR